MTKSTKKAYHFNYFSVDFEEELSALYGPFLEKQTQFLFYSIERIFECYKTAENKPESVIAIGHSMGGLVIRGLLSLPTFDARKISTVIALATPQTQPPICLDQHIDNYYNKVNSFWKRESRKKFDNITLLSIGGSFRDDLVRSDLCLLNTITGDQDHLSELTTTLPRIWLSNDHQCIVWCNQLVRSITRVFFNMIDPLTKQITMDHKKRLKILLQTMFFQHLETKILKKEYYESNCEEISINVLAYIDQKGCYKFTKGSNERLEVWARTERQHTLYQCNAKVDCSSIDYKYHLPGSVPSQFHVVDNYHEGSIIITTKMKEQILIRKVQRGNSPITDTYAVPFIIPALKKISMNETFHTAVYVVGIYSSIQSYYLEVTPGSSRSNYFNCEIVIQIRDSETLKELNVFWFEPHKPVKFQLKMFTLPTNNAVEMHVFSTKEMSEFTLAIIPDIEGLLGQLMRFKLEEILRYSIVLNVACFVFNNKLKMFLQIFLANKLLVSFPVLLNPAAFLYNVVITESFLLLTAFFACRLFSLVSQIAFAFVRVLLYIPDKFAKYVNLQTNEKPYLQVIIKLAFTLLLMQLYFKCGIAFVLIAVLCVCIVQIDLVADKGRKRSLWDHFACFLPISLLFSIPSIVVSLKDILQGFKLSPSRFTNLEILTVLYFVHLLRNNHSLSRDSLNKSSKLTIITSMLVSVFMFKDYVKFFNVTYLVVFCLLFNLCCPVLACKIKSE